MIAAFRQWWHCVTHWHRALTFRYGPLDAWPLRNSIERRCADCRWHA